MENRDSKEIQESIKVQETNQQDSTNKLEDLGIHLSGNKILDKNLKFEVDIITLKKALSKYPNLKYKSDCSYTSFGIVKQDPDLGYVFYQAKYKGKPLM